MIYLLDSNACVEYLRAKNAKFMKRFTSCNSGDIRLCSVVVGELFFGAYLGANIARNLGQVRAFISLYSSLPFEESAAEIFGHIRALLTKAGTPIGHFDFQIAAIALAHGLTLVTHNTAEFKRVPNLQLDDWQI